MCVARWQRGVGVACACICVCVCVCRGVCAGGGCIELSVSPDHETASHPPPPLDFSTHGESQVPVMGAAATPMCYTMPDRPHAWPKLWKHHGAAAQASVLTDVANGLADPWVKQRYMHNDNASMPHLPFLSITICKDLVFADFRLPPC
jgi:hypothetical protein